MTETPTKPVIDCATGETTMVPLTAEEIAFRASLDVPPTPTPEDRIAELEAQVTELIELLTA